MANKKAMPTKKGGKSFPRIELEAAEQIAEKLVSKSHSKPLGKEIYYSAGVLGEKGSRGDTRASALKQYGLVKGTVKAGVEGSDLAKRLVNAVPEEKQLYRRQACLNPVIFEKLYVTFQGDRVSLAKIRQQAASLEVHPENAEECARVFIASAVYAGIAEQSGEEVVLHSAAGLEQGAIDPGDEPDSVDEAEVGDEADEVGGDEAAALATRKRVQRPGGAVINLSLTVDSSMDAEKLEKHLQTLRRFEII